MHTFQPYPFELVEFDPFNKIGNDWMLVTAATKDKVNALTASWGGAGVLWGKNVVYIFIRESRFTKEFIDASDTFSLTFFNKKYKNDLKYFGAVSGRQEDKFKESHMHVNYRGGTPYVDEGELVFLCKKMAAVPITDENFTDAEILENWYAGKDKDNYHTMYVGEIIEVLAR